ncbi:winged helix-turn-helix domain-containing protein [Pandoraea terrae]
MLVSAGIVAGLRVHGLTVDAVSSAAQASLAASAGDFDACILDLGLPDSDGVDLLVKWRNCGVRLPVLILTARAALEHRVNGLRLGADDYLLKPFELDELIARLYAIVRRTSGWSSDKLTHGRVVLETTTREVFLDGSHVPMSRRELAVLEALMLNPSRVLTTDQLHGSVYGFSDGVESNALNVHIHHLRRKLGQQIVETVRGIGYKLGSPAP